MTALYIAAAWLVVGIATCGIGLLTRGAPTWTRRDAAVTIALGPIPLALIAIIVVLGWLSPLTRRIAPWLDAPLARDREPDGGER